MGCKSEFELGLIPADITTQLQLLYEEIIDMVSWQIVPGRYGSRWCRNFHVNMNINEVVANRALEPLGHQKGEYNFTTNNHESSQSTNDAYPTSFHLAIILTNKEVVAETIVDSFRRKAKEFGHVLKMGRTQLQDAVLMTLG